MEHAFEIMRAYANAVGHEIPGLSAYNTGVGNIFTLTRLYLMRERPDLSKATVVTVYLLSSSNEQLRPKLEKELQPGSRVISHDFQFKGWTPTATEEVNGSGRTHRIYLYKMGTTSN